MLLLDDPESQTSHYVWVKSMSRLVAGRTKYEGASFVCNSCLNVFSEQRVLDNHIPHCMQHSPQQVVYPDPHNPDEYKLRFHDHDKEHAMKFFIVCDFESFLCSFSTLMLLVGSFDL